MSEDNSDMVIADVATVFDSHVRRFVAWAAVEWSVSSKDRHDEVFGGESDDYIEGYNAALGGLIGAYECWLEASQ